MPSSSLVEVKVEVGVEVEVEVEVEVGVVRLPDLRTLPYSNYSYWCSKGQGWRPL